MIFETYRFLYKDRITTTVHEKEVPVQSETESAMLSRNEITDSDKYSFYNFDPPLSMI